MTPKPFVLILSSHAGVGGTVVYSKQLQRLVASAGAEAALMSLYRGHSPSEDSEIEPLVGRSRASIATLLTAIAKLFQLMRVRRPDLIIGVMPLANIVAASFAMLFRTKAMATHHLPSWEQARSLRLVDKMLGTLGLYSAIVGVSEAVTKSYAAYPALYKRRLTTIANGYNRLSPSRDRAATRKRHGLDPDRPLILIVSRLAEHKNIVSVLEAVEAIPEAQVAIAGEGPLRRRIERTLKERRLSGRVILLGFRTREEVTNLLHAADAFVQMSHYEGFSISVLEAIGAQIPLALSAIAPHMEATSLGGSEFAAVLCDPADVAQMSAAIRAAATDAETRQNLTKKASVLASRMRSEKEMLGDYAHIFGKLGVYR